MSSTRPDSSRYGARLEDMDRFTVRPSAPQRLARLRAKVRRDLELLDFPNTDWVRPHPLASEQDIIDVVIVGAGQGGLAAGLALWRERIRNILIIDKARQGEEGPWVTFARMRTLRTPKYLTGPDTGIADLTFAAWYEAKYAEPGWSDVERIPRVMWMDYLTWFRGVVDLPVRNEVVLNEIAAGPADLVKLACVADGSPKVFLARKVIMANGLEGSGIWSLPAELSAHLPDSMYCHSADRYDLARLRDKRVAVLGIGASGVDNAAAAMEAGARSVDIFYRRKDVARGERRRWVEDNGFLRHFAELDDADRWRAMRSYTMAGTPAPTWSMQRLEDFANVRLHPAEAWTRTALRSGEVEVTTARASYRFDYLVFATGITVDLDLRPEFRKFRGKIATWGDCYRPPAGQEHAALARYPYLGRGAELTAREAGSAPQLSNIHIFNWGATPSMGISSSSITGMKFGLNRLVAGITRSFYLEYARRHADELSAGRPG